MIVLDRVRGLLGRMPMARLVLVCLAAIALVAVLASIPGWLGYPTPALVTSLVVALVAARLAAALMGAIARAPVHGTSSLITGLILFLLLYPSTKPVDLLLLAAAAVAAAASKYLVTVGGRHVLNPAAAGAFVVGLTGLSGGVWWVANPVLLPLVAVTGLVVALRVGAVLPALVLVAGGALLESAASVVQGAEPLFALTVALTSTPLVFLAGFMFTEPVTLPPRTGQRMLEAGLVAVLLAVPYVLPFRIATLGPSPELALLIGNVLAVLLARPVAAQLRFAGRRPLTASATEYAFTPDSPVRHRAGQYLELQLPHRGADRRGIRRTLTIVSPPGDPALRVAVRTREPMSSFKQALDVLPLGSPVRAVTVSGAFTLPVGPVDAPDPRGERDRDHAVREPAAGGAGRHRGGRGTPRRAPRRPGGDRRGPAVPGRARGERRPRARRLPRPGHARRRARALARGAAVRRRGARRRAPGAAAADGVRLRIAGLRRPRPLGAPRRGGAPRPDRRLRRVLSTLAP